MALLEAYPMMHGWKYLLPEDRENILRGIADGQVYGGPYHIELDWVDKCNARCFFCNSEDLQRGKSLAWPRAEAILEEARAGGLRSIRLSGGGEPTLHPHLPELLEFLGRNGIVLDHLNTNGTMLTDRVIAALGKIKVNDVRISLNYCDEETYAKGMGLASKFFGRVCEMMAALNESRKGNPNFGQLTTQFFIYKPTLHQIREMYNLAVKLGADWITFRELDDIEPALQFTPEDVPRIAEGMREIIRADWRDGRVESLLQHHGAKLAIEKIYTELSHDLGPLPRTAPPAIDYSNKYCYIGWYSMTVMGNQAVYPCCMLLPVKWLPPLDSLESKTLQEVWRGPAYTEFRRQMRDFMLTQQQGAVFNRRFNLIVPGCHTHDECPMTTSMADETFYTDAETRLSLARRTPSVHMRRAMNKGLKIAHAGWRKVR